MVCIGQNSQRFLTMHIARAVLVVASAGLLGGAPGLMTRARAAQASQQPIGEAVSKDRTPTELTYPQVYVSADGATHFRDVRVQLTSETTAPPAEPIAQSEVLAATTIRHAAFPPHWGAYDRDHGVLHNASSARFITVRRWDIW